MTVPVRAAGLTLTVCASADGLNVHDGETDRVSIGRGRNYDVIVEPTEARAFAFVQSPRNRSGGK